MTIEAKLGLMDPKKINPDIRDELISMFPWLDTVSGSLRIKVGKGVGPKQISSGDLFLLMLEYARNMGLIVDLQVNGHAGLQVIIVDPELDVILTTTIGEEPLTTLQEALLEILEKDVNFKPEQYHEPQPWNACQPE
jgi:hypothetical protein